MGAVASDHFRHAALLDEWKARPWHSQPGFCWDGPIDWTSWAQSNAHVIFLLKEAYGHKDRPTDWALQDYVTQQWKFESEGIWTTAGRWAHAAEAALESRRAQFDGIPPQLARAALGRAAVVNIKKSRGVSRSDDKDLEQHVSRDGDMLRRQIELLSPKVVICGRTWPLVRELWPSSTRAGQWMWRYGATLFVDFWHPTGWTQKRKHFGLLSEWLSVALSD